MKVWKLLVPLVLTPVAALLASRASTIGLYLSKPEAPASLNVGPLPIRVRLPSNLATSVRFDKNPNVILDAGTRKDALLVEVSVGVLSFADGKAWLFDELRKIDPKAVEGPRFIRSERIVHGMREELAFAVEGPFLIKIIYLVQHENEAWLAAARAIPDSLEVDSTLSYDRALALLRDAAKNECQRAMEGSANLSSRDIAACQAFGRASLDRAEPTDCRPLIRSAAERATKEVGRHLFEEVTKQIHLRGERHLLELPSFDTKDSDDELGKRMDRSLALQLMLAEAEAILGDIAEACRQFESLAEVEDNDGRKSHLVRLLIGETPKRLTEPDPDPSHDLKCATLLATLEPKSVFALIRLARAQSSAGDLDKAAKTIESALPLTAEIDDEWRRFASIEAFSRIIVARPELGGPIDCGEGASLQSEQKTDPDSGLDYRTEGCVVGKTRAWTGPARSIWLPSGVLKFRGSFIDHIMREGRAEEWYPNGRKRSVTTAHQGWFSGPAQVWDKFGHLRNEGEVTGRYDRMRGHETRYFEDGKKHCEIEYRGDGRAHIIVWNGKGDKIADRVGRGGVSLEVEGEDISLVPFTPPNDQAL